MRHSLAALTAVAGAPLAAGALAVRPAWRVGFRERLGALPRPAPGAVWVHAASVGEMRAATGLVAGLRAEGHAVFTSAVTLSGRELMRRRFADVPCHLAPVDHPWCVDSALARVRPAALVLIETELWPFWIAAAARRGVPVALVSGRVSDRSFQRYRRFGPIVRATLRSLAAIGARSDVDGARFRALGAAPERVSVTGDLKLDQAAAPCVPGDLARALDAGVPVFVAGSTHAGEERAALDALAEVERAGLAARLVLAPRHPARAREVERLVRDAGRPVRRRAALADRPLAADEVLLLDTLGELADVYSLARVAFVGGSLVPRGGHNVLEPALSGRPVLFGPHTDNVRHAVAILERCDAGRRVADARDLARALCALLRDPESARARGERGREALREHCGSARRSLALIESVLADRNAAAI